MMAVPRELFVPPAQVGEAYSDNDIPVGDGRVMLKPMVLAKLIQAALVGPSAVPTMVTTARNSAETWPRARDGAKICSAAAA